MKATSENTCNMGIPAKGGGYDRHAAAFTMAEILLSLTIIGVVAAITLPSLTGNINERTWNTQRKALYARMSQAIALMPSLNGYGTFANATDSTSALDNVTETFITSGLSKVFKINNICTNFADCGIVSQITPMLGNTKINTPRNWEELNQFTTSPNTTWGSRTANINSQAVAFETVNGESILALYNPNCKFYMNEKNSSSAHEYHYSTQEKVCLNFIYDLNSSKGPNTVGKDIGFITILYPADSVVVNPVPATHIASDGIDFDQATRLCKQQDDDPSATNTRRININVCKPKTHLWKSLYKRYKLLVCNFSFFYTCLGARVHNRR